MGTGCGCAGFWHASVGGAQSGVCWVLQHPLTLQVSLGGSLGASDDFAQMCLVLDSSHGVGSS